MKIVTKIEDVEVARRGYLDVPLWVKFRSQTLRDPLEC